MRQFDMDQCVCQLPASLASIPRMYRQGHSNAQLSKGLKDRVLSWHSARAVFRSDHVRAPESSVGKLENGTRSRDLKVMMHTFIDDHEKVLSRMDWCLTHDPNRDDSIRMSLTTLAQNDRRILEACHSNDNDKAEERGDSVVFEGDRAPPQTPPFVWVNLWNGRYSNIYGEYVPQPLRRWGYVVWDKKRWNGLGAKELNFKQWEAHIELAEEIDGDYAWSPVPVSNVSSALASKDVAIGESQSAERQLPRGGHR